MQAGWATGFFPFFSPSFCLLCNFMPPNIRCVEVLFFFFLLRFIYLFSPLPLPPAEILRAPLAHWTTAVPHFHGSCSSFPVSISDKPTHIFHSFHLPKLLTDLSDLMVWRGGSPFLLLHPQLLSLVNPAWFVMEVLFQKKKAKQINFFSFKNRTCWRRARKLKCKACFSFLIFLESTSDIHQHGNMF